MADASDWLTVVAELKQSKRYDEALVIVREHIQRGELAAHVQLALLGSRIGLSGEEIAATIDYVEQRISPKDVEAHWLLSRAYDVRLGSGDYESQDRKTFEHLLIAAQNNDSGADAMAVATFYEFGSLTLQMNREAALCWYQIALQRGVMEAQLFIDRIKGGERRPTRRNKSPRKHREA